MKQLVETATLHTRDGQHNPVYVVNLPGRTRPVIILESDVRRSHRMTTRQIQPDRQVRLKGSQDYHDAICVSLKNGRYGYLLINCERVVFFSDIEQDDVIHL